MISSNYASGDFEMRNEIKQYTLAVFPDTIALLTDFEVSPTNPSKVSPVIYLFFSELAAWQSISTSH